MKYIGHLDFLSNKESIDELLHEHCTFTILNIPEWHSSQVTDELKKRMKSLNLTCRVYRILPFDAFEPLNVIERYFGTWNPDYEIKEYNGYVLVAWKK